MTTTEAVRTATCPTCRGAGTITVPAFTDEQRPIVAQLIDAGELRARHSAKRKLEDVIAKNKAYDDIRKLAVEAFELGLTRTQVADAVGVSRNALHDILTGKSGG